MIVHGIFGKIFVLSVLHSVQNPMLAALAPVGGRYAVFPYKQSVKMRIMMKAAFICDFLGRVGGNLQQVFGFLQSDSIEVFKWRDAVFFFK